MSVQETILNLMRCRISMLKVNEAIREKRFSIPLHLGLGHEAIAVAVASMKESQDTVALSHRNMHYNFAVQKEGSRILQEYLLSESGLKKGNYGSMNLIQPENGIVYTSSILGNNLCVAVGIAKGNQINERQKGTDSSVTVVVTGDGAMEEGAFYESLLMAKTSKVPMIVLVENNGWSMYTQIHERRFEIDLPKLGDSLSIPTYQLNSNDAIEYIEQLKDIRLRAIEDSTPIIVEVSVHTLGDYWVEDPNRRIINYHHGLAPKIDQSAQSIVHGDAMDPLHVASKYVSAEEWSELEQTVLTELEGFGGEQ